MLMLEQTASKYLSLYQPNFQYWHFCLFLMDHVKFWNWICWRNMLRRTRTENKNIGSTNVYTAKRLWEKKHYTNGYCWTINHWNA